MGVAISLHPIVYNYTKRSYNKSIKRATDER